MFNLLVGPLTSIIGDTVKGFLTKEQVDDIIEDVRNLPGTV